MPVANNNQEFCKYGIPTPVVRSFANSFAGTGLLKKKPCAASRLVRLQKSKFRGRFHALADNPQVQAASHADDGADNGRFAGSSGNLPHKRLGRFSAHR